MRQLLESIIPRLFRLRKIAGRQDPDGDTYLERYYVYGSQPGDERVTPFGIVFHRFLQSDNDDDLHNHPWRWCFSIILAGGYHEEYFEEPHGGVLTPVGRELVVKSRRLLPGMAHFFEGTHFHRVDLIEKDCWTLFIYGPRIATWGFKDRHNGVFTHWRDRLRERGLL